MSEKKKGKLPLEIYDVLINIKKKVEAGEVEFFPKELIEDEEDEEG